MCKKKKIIYICEVLSVVLLGILLFGIVYYFMGMYFETNDDIFISKFFYGSITGSIEYHTIYGNVLYGIPLSIMYVLFPKVEWYGILLLVISLLSVTVPMIAINCSAKKYWIKLVNVLFFSSVFFAFLYCQCLIQYTVIASMVGFSGYISYVFFPKLKHKIIFFTLFECLSYGLRPEAMEMVLPFGGALVVGVFFFHYIIRKKECSKDISDETVDNTTKIGKKVSEEIKYCAIAILIPICVVLLGTIAQKIFYSDEQYQNAVSVNAARAALFDYDGAPDYSEVQNILENANVSRAEYEAYCNYINYRWDISNGVLEKIADHSKEIRENKKSFYQVLLWTIKSYNEWPWRLKDIFVVVILTEIVIVAIVRKPSALIFNAFYICAKIAVWGLIYYNGRMPNRVMFPLYYIEIVYHFIIVVLLLNLSVQKKMIQRVVVGIAIGCSIIAVGIFSFKCVKEEYRFLLDKNCANKLLSRVEDEVGTYVDKYGEKRFLLSPRTYGYWNKRVFDVNVQHNFRYSGGWFSSNPYFKTYVDEYLADEDFYYILSPEDDSSDSQLKCLASMYNCEPVMVDTISVCTGSYYCVYLIENNNSD